MDKSEKMHQRQLQDHKYATEEDKAVLRSPNHPTNVVEPRTASAIRARAGKGRIKGKHVSSTEGANIVLQQIINGRLELLALANSRTQQGDSRLYDFVLNRSQKMINELVETVWEVETATEKIARSTLSRIDILREQLTSTCICEGEWLQCALEILSKNSIDRAVFDDAIISLLVMGRGKGLNIYINGPANCGKTFILDPLRHIFDTFLSPATCSYA